MSFSCKVGSFTVPAATGNQATTGVGFQPTAVIFFALRRSADGKSSNASENEDMVGTLLGFGAAGPTFGSVACGSDFTSGGLASQSACIFATEPSIAPTPIFAANFVSLDADGFTVNWTTVKPTAYVINYLALGGDLTNAKVVSFTGPNGGATGSQAVTGVGFQPDAVLFAYASNNSVNLSGGVGMASSSSAMAAASAEFTSATNRYQRIDKCIVAFDATTVLRQATLTSFDSDGLTLNWDAASGSDVLTVRALCLKGGQFKVFSDTQKTSTGTQAKTGIGFQPTGILVSSTQKTAGTTLDTTDIARQLGAASSTTARASIANADNNNGCADLTRTKVIEYIDDDGTPTTFAAADLSSFDADGYTLNWTTADATARQFFGMAFGSAGGGAPADTQEWRGCLPVDRRRDDRNIGY